MDLNLLNKKNNFFEKMRFSALLTAGNIDNFNTMTIGWATMGVLWGKNVMIVYVRPSRYTYEFMEREEYFTVSFYNDEYKKDLNYLGTRSGRDMDKVGDVGFHKVEFGQSVSFCEASLTVLCKKIYWQDFNNSDFLEEVKQRYYPKNDNHRFYIGEIVDISEEIKQ